MAQAKGLQNCKQTNQQKRTSPGHVQFNSCRPHRSKIGLEIEEEIKMTQYPMLITLEQNQSYRTCRLQYQAGTLVSEDRLGVLALVADQASAAGWLQGPVPLLQDQGRIRPHRDCQTLPQGHGGRLSPEGRWEWRIHPLQGWPPPFQLFERDRLNQRENTVWEKPGWEILDLQIDPNSPGVYFAVQPPLGPPQLLHWNPLRRKLQCVLRHVDFRPIEFAVAPDGQSLAFVHQSDDQLYRLDRVSHHLIQLSIPQLEGETQAGYRAYRTSPAYSPDGQRIFYCTAYLELSGLELNNWGHLYALPAQGGALMRLECPETEESCPINLRLPSPRVWKPAQLARAS
jgi:hypothetical protein